MAVEFIHAEFGSPHYRKNLALRQTILRAPLGLSLNEEDTGNDVHEHHFCAIADGAVIACVQLRPLGDRILKLRQMAVVEKSRGAGIGAGLVRFAEGWARREGFQNITMHARGTAIGFYEKLGYGIQGDMFAEHTIPHVVMTKALV